VEINNRILDLAPDGLEYMGITGGEPTLYEGELLSLMAKVHRTYPNLPISLLTNGRRFQDRNLVRRMSAIGHKKLMACIPLYAANHAQHDRIVGRNGAFVETLRGIFNLYQAGILVEIRIVIGRFNNLWLQDISEFLLRNLPFVRHIAFMGMEYTGNALKNYDEIVIDPYDYRNELDQATWRLHRRGMNVSIYNIPLCLLERRSWIFARDSISAWKKEYVEKCEDCQQRTKCCGLFATSNYISGNLHTL
jgi:His-Xaa-Ser system radical SAM maturase HxsC